MEYFIENHKWIKRGLGINWEVVGMIFKPIRILIEIILFIILFFWIAVHTSLAI